ncbi:sensor histidine kinase [Paenibacillus senegalensis]|uniref:sensor histidine kinase n=1 Tax=Paenibacillus senegalensis TaxID=1465766 RepID=UPI000288EBDC|nr:HAMP domain-containing sensor histidine kinase [Paenibacillus senegalensis]
MRTFRIRTFTLVCFIFILSMPWIFFVTTHYMETKTFNIINHRQQNEVLQTNKAEIIHLIETNTTHWTEPEWQKQLYTRLQEANMDAAILSGTDEHIYRSNPERRGSSSSIERFSILEDGEVLGRVVLYLPRTHTVQMVSAFAGFLFALFVVGVVMRSYLLKPLEKMGDAARQLASGNWEVRLPVSRISEVADVRDGFEVMVQGLQQSHQKQAALEEERRFVIAALAHDLRTPLFALRGYLEGLEQGIAQSPEKMAKYIAVCKEKSTQLDRLVEELFTFTKVEYLEAELALTKVDLNRILKQSIDSLRPLAKQKNISISHHFTNDCILAGNSLLLERAMNNLLDNAVRYTPNDGDIVVECCADNHKVKFNIRDTGPGFSAEELQRVFEPLYRGESSRNRSTGGSGLGLTISQRIVRRHGGELTATSHPEGGALLEGWIPRTI